MSSNRLSKRIKSKRAEGKYKGFDAIVNAEKKLNKTGISEDTESEDDEEEKKEIKKDSQDNFDVQRKIPNEILSNDIQNLILSEIRRLVNDFETEENQEVFGQVTAEISIDIPQLLLRKIAELANVKLAKIFTRTTVKGKIENILCCQKLLREAQQKIEEHKKASAKLKPNIRFVQSNKPPSVNTNNIGSPPEKNVSVISIGNKREQTFETVDNQKEAGAVDLTSANNKDPIGPDDENEVGNESEEQNSSKPSDLIKTEKESHDGDDQLDTSHNGGAKTIMMAENGWIRTHGSQMHIKDPAKAKFTCDICGYRSSAQGVRHHKRRYHSTSSFVCDVCNKIFGAPSELNIHKKSHIGKDGVTIVKKLAPGFTKEKLGKGKVKFTCNVCEGTFGDIVLLKKHLLSHEQEKAVTNKEKAPCPHCDKVCQNVYQLKNHILRIHSDAQIPCSECTKVYKTEGDMKRHHKIYHQDNKEYICDLCGKKFNEMRYLSVHKKRHNKDFKHFCENCGKGFVERHKLLQHEEIHLPAEQRNKFICGYCGKGFFKKAYLKDHENIHTGALPYKCKECGKGFKLASTLHKHKLFHSKTRKHVCNFPGCSKSFYIKARLKYHMVTHTGSSKFVCQYCNKVFTQNSTLRRHRCKVQHSTLALFEEKPLVDSTQIDKQQQIQEIEVTQGNTSTGNVGVGEVYMCSVCDSIFMAWEDIKNHMLVHSNEDATAGDMLEQSLEGETETDEQLNQDNSITLYVTDETVSDHEGQYVALTQNPTETTMDTQLAASLLADLSGGQ